MQTRLLLADPHRIVREGLRALLHAPDDRVVVAEASDGYQARELVLRLDPDVVVMGLALPRLGGVETTRQITRSAAHTKVLILSALDTRTQVERALRAGAAGYMVKTESSKELLRAIEIVRDGGAYISPTIARHVVDSITGAESDAPDGLGALSGREREVLTAIAEGLSSKEISATLCVSVKTVDSHRSNIMEKLGIHKVSGLVRFAIREGLIAA